MQNRSKAKFLKADPLENGSLHVPGKAPLAFVDSFLIFFELCAAAISFMVALTLLLIIFASTIKAQYGLEINDEQQIFDFSMPNNSMYLITVALIIAVLIQVAVFLRNYAKHSIAGRVIGSVFIILLAVLAISTFFDKNFAIYESSQIFRHYFGELDDLSEKYIYVDNAQIAYTMTMNDEGSYEVHVPNIDGFKLLNERLDTEYAQSYEKYE